ncbi:MAG: dUTP diphosphatase [Acidimicrobiia bacterium]
MQAKFQRLDKQVTIPTIAHIGDAAVDLHCRDSLTLKPGERAAVRTGIAVSIPEGFAGFVLPRSGHAKHSGISVVNGPGLIDSGYRGEIDVLLINHGENAVRFEAGDGIAQLAILAVPQVEWVEVDELDETERGADGFGSTGR